MATLYTYIGNGDVLVHVPPRDLTDADLAERAELWAENGITESVLIGCGLYAPVEPEKKKKSTTKGSAYLEAAKDGE